MKDFFLVEQLSHLIEKILNADKNVLLFIFMVILFVFPAFIKYKFLKNERDAELVEKKLEVEKEKIKLEKLRLKLKKRE